MVFQNYALYPHMTVFDNLAFALKVQGLKKAEIAERVGEVAGIVELEDYLLRKPVQLSGGQRQRVAMARAMVRNTGLFLLDEPLSNLDAKLRTQMRVEIRKLHDRLGATSIYVTHDQTEAMTLADKIVVLNDGRIEQVGTADDLYENPKTLFVAGFLGSPPMNFLPGSMVGLDGDATVGVRPEKLRLQRRSDHDLHVVATLELIEYLGSSALFHCNASASSLWWRHRAKEDLHRSRSRPRPRWPPDGPSAHPRHGKDASGSWPRSPPPATPPARCARTGTQSLCHILYTYRVGRLDTSPTDLVRGPEVPGKGI